jgi:hypothetical protein
MSLFLWTKPISKFRMKVRSDTMYLKPSIFFKRFLLITIISIIVVPVAVALVSTSAVLGYIALAIVVFDLIIVVVYWFIAIIHMFKYVFDRSKNGQFGMHVLNVLFATGVAFVIGLFYLYIVLGVFAVLLPFIA